KKQAPVNEVARVTPEEIVQAIQVVQQSEEPIAVASTSETIYPSKATVIAPVKSQSLTMSKEDKHEMKRQMKAAIKDYKKQSHDGTKSAAAGGNKNQLVAL